MTASTSARSLHEIALLAERDYANPYTEVDVIATFREPSGPNLRVRAFWDGGASWRVRFTPPRAGAWAWQTIPSTGDPGLARSGSLLAVDDGSRGFLRRDAQHPEHFVFDDGSRYFMLGQTYYEIIRNAWRGSRWQRAIDRTRAFEMNKVRMLLYTWGADQNDYPDPVPFVAGNHDRLHVQYWQKIDEIVHYLAERGMLAELLFFTDHQRTFGTEPQDLRYVRYAVARYAAFTNVIWCLTNEWQLTGHDQQYWNRIGQLVKTDDPWLARADGLLRPLSIHATGDPQFKFFDQTWPAHAVIQFGNDRNNLLPHGDQWGVTGILANVGRGLPVVNDEHAYIGARERPPSPPAPTISRRKHRQVVWGVGIAGGYQTIGDARVFAGGSPIFTADWHPAKEYQDVAKFARFFATGKPYHERHSDNSVILSGERAYALVADGETIVYAAIGGRLTLRLPQGTWDVTRFDPVSGATVSLPAVAGGTAQVSLRAGKDWVLRLVRRP